MTASTRVASLENEVEAQILASELSARNIPHVMRSYHDIAYGGIFQTQRGWGYVEAPEEYKREILTILEDMRQGEE